MKFIVITLFPDMIKSFLSESILKRAEEKRIFSVEFINLRDFGIGSRRQVDDTPYGGGSGMVLKVDVVNEAIATIKKLYPKAKVILLTPQGKTLKQNIVQNLCSEGNDLIIICGRYEGFDERIRKLVDFEISIGDYVLTGGEIAAAVVIDSMVRLLPGALGGERSSIEESHSDEGVLEYPQYTRPLEFKGEKVPDILLSGNHAEIAKWRKEQSRIKTKQKK
jgi:tRNA (guanine37-N1)-methyltransferase